MPFTLQDLTNAGLPAVSTDGNNSKASTQFSRELTPAEWQTYLSIADSDQAKKLQAVIDLGDVTNLLMTITQTDYDTWCNNNLMSDTAIDGLTSLSVVLRTNLKANNRFTRQGGKLLITARDVIKWLVKQVL